MSVKEQAKCIKAKVVQKPLSFNKTNFGGNSPHTDFFATSVACGVARNVQH